jgi:hypothetical protein
LTKLEKWGGVSNYLIFHSFFNYEGLDFSPKFCYYIFTTERVKMLGYKTEDIENMVTVLNYAIHHHIKDTKFAAEDREVLRQLEDLLLGLLAEGRV